MDQNFERFSKLPPGDVFLQLQTIKQELCWLDDTIALTKDQRQLFSDINNRVKDLLGNDR